MNTQTASPLPLLLEEVEVARVERLSPSFVRVELAAPGLAEFGVDGPLYDQRFKLVFPNARGELADFTDADESGFGSWLDLPQEERGPMRTYTIRDIAGTGAATRIVVDFVLHGDGDAHGPGGDWAASAAVGDRLVTLAPRRGVPFGGIEFDPPATATEIVLVGDETALPAIAGILRDLPPRTRGAAFIEVPRSTDVLTVQHPEGMTLAWLPRDGGARGEVLHSAVLAHLGAESVALEPPADDEVDPELWETPTFSSSGEDVARTTRTVGHEYDGLYAWIAGESTIVTTLRRALVNELRVDRHQVAFMGYWRRGVAMRS